MQQVSRSKHQYLKAEHDYVQRKGDATQAGALPQQNHISLLV